MREKQAAVIQMEPISDRRLTRFHSSAVLIQDFSNPGKKHDRVFLVCVILGQPVDVTNNRETVKR